jgi:hypothetical protein
LCDNRKPRIADIREQVHAQLSEGNKSEKNDTQKKHKGRDWSLDG